MLAEPSEEYATTGEANFFVAQRSDRARARSEDLADVIREFGRIVDSVFHLVAEAEPGDDIAGSGRIGNRDTVRAAVRGRSGIGVPPPVAGPVASEAIAVEGRSCE